MRYCLILCLLLGLKSKPQEVYMTSMTLTEEFGTVIEVVDSCRVVDSYPSLVGLKFGSKFVVEGYPMVVAHIKSSDRNSKRFGPSAHIDGLASCYGTLYSIRQTNYLGDLFIVWILPIKFHIKSPLVNKRGFVFSNDPKVIKQFKQCNYESESLQDTKIP